MTWGSRGPKGPRGAAGPQGEAGSSGAPGAAGPTGVVAISLISSGTLTGPRDADLALPIFVGAGRQITFEIELSCFNKTSFAYRTEMFRVMITHYANGTVQTKWQQTGSSLLSSTPYAWNGAIQVAFVEQADGIGYRVRAICTGPANATLPAGCAWTGAGSTRYDRAIPL